ncbi:MAG: hypothetical protein ABIH83_02970 [Candidatus Micrarchaeota archaeon]
MSGPSFAQRSPAENQKSTQTNETAQSSGNFLVLGFLPFEGLPWRVGYAPIVDDISNQLKDPVVKASIQYPLGSLFFGKQPTKKGEGEVSYLPFPNDQEILANALSSYANVRMGPDEFLKKYNSLPDDLDEIISKLIEKT